MPFRRQEPGFYIKIGLEFWGVTVLFCLTKVNILNPMDRLGYINIVQKYDSYSVST